MLVAWWVGTVFSAQVVLRAAVHVTNLPGCIGFNIVT
jgi:hypothetical protein